MWCHIHQTALYEWASHVETLLTARRDSLQGLNFRLAYEGNSGGGTDVVTRGIIPSGQQTF